MQHAARSAVAHLKSKKVSPANQSSSIVMKCSTEQLPKMGGTQPKGNAPKLFTHGLLQIVSQSKESAIIPKNIWAMMIGGKKCKQNLKNYRRAFKLHHPFN